MEIGVLVFIKTLWKQCSLQSYMYMRPIALKSLLQNQDSFETESWYITSGTQWYQVCLNDDTRMTFDLLQYGHICVPIHFLYSENIEKSFIKE